jgi:hypothetical protein
VPSPGSLSPCPTSNWSRCWWNGPGRGLQLTGQDGLLQQLAKRVEVRRSARSALASIEYELAAEGEDLGRLVAVTDDSHGALVHRALKDSAPDITMRSRHAIAPFRGRDTSAESKRSSF